MPANPVIRYPADQHKHTHTDTHANTAHINHIKRVAGIDHVGLGAGYDGINL